VARASKVGFKASASCPPRPLRLMLSVGPLGKNNKGVRLLEALKGMPVGAVWDYHCLTQGVPPDVAYIDEIRTYEKTVLAQRG